MNQTNFHDFFQIFWDLIPISKTFPDLEITIKNIPWLFQVFHERTPHVQTLTKLTHNPIHILLWLLDKCQHASTCNLNQSWFWEYSGEPIMQSEPRPRYSQRLRELAAVMLRSQLGNGPLQLRGWGGKNEHTHRLSVHECPHASTMIHGVEPVKMCVCVCVYIYSVVSASGRWSLFCEPEHWGPLASQPGRPWRRAVRTRTHLITCTSQTEMTVTIVTVTSSVCWRLDTWKYLRAAKLWLVSLNLLCVSQVWNPPTGRMAKSDMHAYISVFFGDKSQYGPLQCTDGVFESQTEALLVQ